MKSNQSPAEIKDQIKSALRILAAVGEAIQDLKQVPSGDLYGMLMGLMDLATYQRIIDQDRKSTRLNSSHIQKSRMPSSA